MLFQLLYEKDAPTRPCWVPGEPERLALVHAEWAGLVSRSASFHSKMPSARPLLVDASLRLQVGYPGEQEPEERGILPEGLKSRDPEALAEFVAAQATEHAPDCETVFVCVVPDAFSWRICGDLCARLFKLLPGL